MFGAVCALTTDYICNVVKRFTVAEWLTHFAATLEVMGSRPSLGDISEIYFLEPIQSLA